ncbi:UNVERIFIED_CONTAM: hypothetical protein Sradi_7108700 [Sesamum radiatum]|uniref:Reverse transcriptase domain-containing protein n=1 Tax=Sesamum radiatum TaxID=300843 RepID=A0AAW2J0T6_SESRA
MDEANLLLTPVTQQEIKEAFFDINDDSAPGPDGYSSAFYKNAWPVIGMEVCSAVSEFFQSSKMLKQVNTTLLVLIPKVQLPSSVSDFRPIACCNVIYKAIAKILVRRMQQVLHLLIDSSQNAFVPGRSIADNVLLAQELLSGYNVSKMPLRCTIKVDIQKAYDSGSRGLRQGDPLSPYLFVIVMELWHVLLKLSVQNSDTFSYHWKCTHQSVSIIKDSLSTFAAMAGLHVNPNKSQVILSKSVRSGRQHLINLMGFREGNLPIKYLGVPLVASRLTIEDCKPLLHKIDSRLAGWSHHSFSMAGRVQILKSKIGCGHFYGKVHRDAALLKCLGHKFVNRLRRGARVSAGSVDESGVDDETTMATSSKRHSIYLGGLGAAI